ncbi:leukemia inhibitory factor receptor, partial [Silurus meridionalis]
PLQAPDVHLSSSVSSHSITLEWSFEEENPTHPGFITGYTLTVHTEPNNTHGVYSETVYGPYFDDPHCKRVTVEGLCESQRYTLRLAACTRAGCGTESVYTFKTRPKSLTFYTFYCTHTHTVFTDYMQVLKVVTPLLLLIGCCCFLWSYRNTVKGIVVDVLIFPRHHNMKMMELDDDVYEVSKEIGALEVEECESCDVEIMEQEIQMRSFFSLHSNSEEFITVTNLTYLLLSNTPEHTEHYQNCRRKCYVARAAVQNGALVTSQEAEEQCFFYFRNRNRKQEEKKRSEENFSVSKEIGALEVEECESCDVEIMEQEIQMRSFFSLHSNSEEFITVTNLTYLLLSNTPEHTEHCGSSSSGYMIPTSPP